MKKTKQDETAETRVAATAETETEIVYVRADGGAFALGWTAATGSRRGACVVLDPTRDGVQQANTLLAALHGVGGPETADMPPVVRIETAGGQTPAYVAAVVISCLRRIEDFTGEAPLLACPAGFLSENNLTDLLRDYTPIEDHAPIIDESAS